MRHLTHHLHLRSLLLLTLLGGIFSACSAVPTSSTAEAPQSIAGGAAPAGMPAAPPEIATDSATENRVVTDAGVPRSQPQLVKTGEITLTVDSVQQSLEKVTAIARQQRGDLLRLQNQSPDDPAIRHTALLQMRVPQQNLDATLKALAGLGTVQQQAIAAEDVASQLVDFQARLRNLRKTEATLLKIMDRSGSMNDVLKVAQELSNVRNSIEQVDAQVKDLQNRVAYSVITVNLQEAIATVPPQPALQNQVQETWEQATHSVGSFTVGLMKLGLWLLAYSPYWLALALGAIALRRWRRPMTSAATQSEPPTSS